MPIIELSAIVLRTYKLADADKIVVLLSAEYGVTRGVARGARRLKSRFGAGLEPYTLIAAQLYEREGKELVSLSQAEIIRSYFDLAKSEEVYAVLSYLSELTIEFIPPHEPNPLVFRMVKACLEALATHPHQAARVARYFEIWLLKLGGFLPDLTRCGQCQRLYEARVPIFFRWGDVTLCRFCAPQARPNLLPSLREAIDVALHQTPENFARNSDNIATSDEWKDLADWTKTGITRVLERERK